MHFVRVLSWIAAQLVFCHIALAVQLMDIGDVNGVSISDAFGQSVLPILPSYRIYVEDFRDVNDMSSKVCTCSWQDENQNNIGQSESFNLSLGFSGHTIWIGPPPLKLHAVQTIALPLPSSWPVMRSLMIHKEGTASWGDHQRSYTLFDLPSNGKPGPLIHFRAVGTATWVPYAEDRGYSSDPATYLGAATTYDIAIGHVEPRTNPIPLGTDATQIPLVKISSSNGYSFVAGQGNMSVGGPAYYNFPWSMPSGTGISYKIQLYWMSPWEQAITERTLVSGPKVPAKTIQYLQAAYAGEPLYFSPDNPITDVPIQSTTRTVELISFSHGDTVAKSTTAVSRSFTPVDATPELVVPSVIELGFYYLRVSWATAPSKFYYSSLFRVNKAFGLDVKINGVSPAA
ncbi:hypothetical protein HDU90_003888 [Geranomyces variabilis]|nr:hypothetical protein HDU90_003888 [Geranomyces variabilis]